MPQQVVIVGGGAIGSAIAYFLAADPAFGGDVTVIERDPTYRQASSALSASSLREQFTTPLNIAMSRFGLEFIRSVPERMAVDGDCPHLNFHEKGYLILATAEGLATLRSAHHLQRGCDVPVMLMDPAELQSRFPWLSTDGIAGGSFGFKNEGWFDGYALLQVFRRKARALGVRYMAEEAVGFERAGDRVSAAMLKNGERVPGDLFVNAGGPWGGKVAALLGVDIPVFARKRNVFVFTCPAALPDFPLLLDPAGFWVRPEGDRYIVGSSPKAGEPDPDDLPLDVDHASFDEVIWPLLAERVPAFEVLKPAGSWAGYYEMNDFDRNGIVGPHPALSNVLFANGFSGHGIQHSPAVGRGLAEYIVHGRYQSLDLSPLSVTRIIENRPMVEMNIY